MIFLKDFIYLFSERGEGRQKERERNINVWLHLTCPPTGDLACKPGMCPERDSNQQPFSLQASTQSTEPHQPGQENQYSLKSNIHIYLLWLSGLSAGLQTRGSRVRFPVRAHAWVVGQVPNGQCLRGNHTLMFLSLSFILPSISPKINKQTNKSNIFFLKVYKKTVMRM